MTKSIRLNERDNEIIAKILADHPILNGKVSAAVRLALHGYDGKTAPTRASCHAARKKPCLPPGA